ncbi:hypothetical protein [Sphingorhabdus sp.]|uniref:hypothetical protein n=1 Tax=Sphingorhabdus sp. TaxID=1902408 RepID=UPI003BAECE75
MTHRIVIIVTFAVSCALISAAPASAAKPTPWTDNYGEARSPTIPKDVRKFVIAAQACAHFSGEEAFDEERGRFLAKMIRKNCANIEARREKLLTKHKGNAEVEAIIAEIWEPFA